MVIVKVAASRRSEAAEADPCEGESAAALVRRIAGGDGLAETELVKRYGPSLRFFLRRLTRDPELAEDLFQTTFSVVLERLRGRGLDDPAGLTAFVRGTARNLLRNEKRKGIRRLTEVSHPSFGELPGPASSMSPLDRLLQHEKTALVHRLLVELRNQRDREILFRVYLAEEEMEVISRDLGLELVHFYRVLYRARQRLKRLLEDCSKEGERG